MAKKLERPQPSSSIANVLSLDAARAATGDPSRHQLVSTDAFDRAEAAPTFGERGDAVPSSVDLTRASSAAPTGEFPRVFRQFRLTRSADDTLQAITDAYGRATGLQLTRSEFLRAILCALRHALPMHEREARQIGPLRRPKNEARLFHKRDELERAIARAFIAAMRVAPAME